MRKVIAAVMMLSWEAVRFNLAYKKGQMDATVDWIGGSLFLNATGIVAKVKDSIVDDIRDDLRAYRGLNVLPTYQTHEIFCGQGKSRCRTTTRPTAILAFNLGCPPQRPRWGSAQHDMG